MPNGNGHDKSATALRQRRPVMITHYRDHRDSISPLSSAANHWVFVLIMTLLGAAAAFAVSFLMTPQLWEATALARVGRAEVFGNAFTDPAYIDRVQQTVNALAAQPEVESAAWASAGVDPADRGRISSSVKNGSELLLFSVQAHGATEAQTTLTALLSTVRDKVGDVYGKEVAFEKVGEQAPSPVPSQTLLKSVLGGFAGFLVGVGLSWGLDAWVARKPSRADR